jgi:TonB family protein
MNKIKMLAGAAIVSGLLSTFVFASAATNAAPDKALLNDVPHPAVVVSPTGIPDNLVDATVRFAMTVDENGQPHNIRLVSPRDRALEKKLVPVIAQWRFTPAIKDGEPVEMRVVLPVKLAVNT